MDDQARIPAPNYTQIPNVILDLMSDMDDTEFRVVIAIARQTFGWHKKRDKISLSQLQKLTGLSRQGVVNGIAAGEGRGLIEKTKDESDKRGGIWYRLLVNSIDQSTELTSYTIDQSTELTRTSQLNGLELVNSVDTQKKEKEKKESGDGNTPARPLSELALAIADVCKINPQIPTDKQRRALNATYQALKTIGATPDDVRARERWWYANDWRAKKEGRAPRPDELQAIWEEAAAPIKHAPANRPPVDLPTITAEQVAKKATTGDAARRIIEETRAKAQAGK